MGSAILLISCGGNAAASEGDNIPTMRGDTVTMYETEEGRLASRYYTPLLEKYGNAPEPYDEYKYGVDIIQYDTLGNVKSTFRSNYAIHFINLGLWEAKGDVVVTNEGGDRLETQQLFWNEKTKRIYSNVDTHFYRADRLIRGESFESNEDLSDYEVRNARGRITVDVEPTRDTTGVARDTMIQLPVITDPAPMPPSMQNAPARTRDTARPSAARDAAQERVVRESEPPDVQKAAPGRVSHDSLPPRIMENAPPSRVSGRGKAPQDAPHGNADMPHKNG